MMIKVRINSLVVEDLKKIKEFIAEDNPEMAIKTVQEIYSKFENIQQHPGIGADLARTILITIENNNVWQTITLTDANIVNDAKWYFPYGICT